MESVQARNNGGKSGVVYSHYSVALSLTIIDGYAKVPLRAIFEARQSSMISTVTHGRYH
jgi:hypothetical protein